MSKFILFLALWFPVFCLRLFSYAPVFKVYAMTFECSVIRYPLSFSYLVQFFNCCSTLGRPILFNQSRLSLMENCMPQYYSCFGIPMLNSFSDVLFSTYLYLCIKLLFHCCVVVLLAVNSGIFTPLRH